MKFRLLLLVVTLLFTCTGCAFAGIGAGIGSAFPKTERVSEPERDAPVDVHADSGETTSGRYIGEEPGNLVLLRHDEIVRVGKEHVAEVRKRKGSHWVEGFLVGGAIDLVVSGVLAYLAVQSLGSGLSAMGGM
jgi:hypothetical protein